MSKNNCGCEIVSKNYSWEIAYCPTHAAAFEMREALLQLKEHLQALHLHFGDYGLTIPLLQKAGQALVLAEGKEAEHE